MTKESKDPGSQKACQRLLDARNPFALALAAILVGLPMASQTRI